MKDKRVARGFQDAGTSGAAIQVTERGRVLATRSRVKKIRPSEARHSQSDLKIPRQIAGSLKIYLPYSAIIFLLQVLHRIAIGGQ